MPLPKLRILQSISWDLALIILIYLAYVMFLKRMSVIYSIYNKVCLVCIESEAITICVFLTCLACPCVHIHLFFLKAPSEWWNWRKNTQSFLRHWWRWGTLWQSLESIQIILPVILGFSHGVRFFLDELTIWVIIFSSLWTKMKRNLSKVCGRCNKAIQLFDLGPHRIQCPTSALNPTNAPQITAAISQEENIVNPTSALNPKNAPQIAAAISLENIVNSEVKSVKSK